MNPFISIPLVAVNGIETAVSVTKNSSYFEAVRALNTDELAKFPTGNAVIESRHSGNGEQLQLIITTLSVSAIQSAINAAISGFIAKGAGVLIGGTVAITVPGVTSSNLGFRTLAVPNTAALTLDYKVVCSANTVTITALLADRTINAADISTINYFVL